MSKIIPAISVKNFSFYYNKQKILENLSMDIPQNKIIAIMGPSGCGKSTFLKSLNRMSDLEGEVQTEGKIEFFALDTNDNAPWEAQLAWLDLQLAKSTAPWKIVYGHHPLYSSGRHGGDRELVAKLAPIFAKHKVSIYLCGHDHGYERSIPIDGTVYIVNGGGGAPLYKFGKSPQTAFVSSQFSFITFDVYQDKIITKAISTDGKVFDRAIITKI